MGEAQCCFSRLDEEPASGEKKRLKPAVRFRQDTSSSSDPPASHERPPPHPNGSLRRRRPEGAGEDDQYSFPRSVDPDAFGPAFSARPTRWDSNGSDNSEMWHDAMTGSKASSRFGPEMSPRRSRMNTFNGKTLYGTPMNGRGSSMSFSSVATNRFRAGTMDQTVETWFEEKTAGSTSIVDQLNVMTLALWPKVNTWLQGLVTSKIEPALNNALPSWFKGGIKIDKFDLGCDPPSFEHFFVATDDADFGGEGGGEGASGGVSLHTFISLSNDVEVEVEAFHIKFGIHQIKITGEFTLLFSPLIPRPPFFGALQLFFANPPQISIDFTGMAKLANVPGIRGAVRQAIFRAIANACVLPRRICARMGRWSPGCVDLMDLRYPEPEGVLRLCLVKLTHKYHDPLVRSSSLDGRLLKKFLAPLVPVVPRIAYVEVMVGTRCWQSPAVAQGQDGQHRWEEAVEDFPLHDLSQTLSITVFEDGVVAGCDQVALAKPVPITCVLEEGHCNFVRLPLVSVEHEEAWGTIFLKVECLPLSVDPPSPLGTPQTSAPSVAYLSLKVLDVWDVPEEVEPPVSVRLGLVEGAAGDMDQGAPDDSLQEASSRTASLRMLAEAFRGGRQRRQIAEAQLSRRGAPRCDGFVKAKARTPNGKATTPRHRLTPEQQHVALELQRIGTYRKSDIAQVLGTSASDVEAYFEAEGSAILEAERASALGWGVSMPGQVTNHMINDVIQMLLPSVPDGCDMEVSLVDKHRNAVGSILVPMNGVLVGDEPRPDGGTALRGPFILESGAAAGARIVGGAWLRWVSHGGEE